MLALEGHTGTDSTSQKERVRSKAKLWERYLGVDVFEAFGSGVPTARVGPHVAVDAKRHVLGVHVVP